MTAYNISGVTNSTLILNSGDTLSVLSSGTHSGIVTSGVFNGGTAPSKPAAS